MVPHIEVKHGRELRPRVGRVNQQLLKIESVVKLLASWDIMLDFKSVLWLYVNKCTAGLFKGVSVLLGW